MSSKWSVGTAMLFTLLLASCGAGRLPVIAVRDCDFDNNGQDDLAIGVPFEDVGGVTDAGAVNVLYGSPGGLTGSGNQFWHQDSADILDTAEANDRFGWALVCGNFNGDAFDDLAIGVPLEDLEAIADAGAINVLYGSASGLTGSGNQFWHQDSADVPDSAEAGDGLGFSLASGDFNGSGEDDLAVGVPFEDVEGISDPGAVSVIYGSSMGLTADGSQLWHQDSPDIPDEGEATDSFGFSLTSGDFDGRDDPWRLERTSRMLGPWLTAVKPLADP